MVMVIVSTCAAGVMPRSVLSCFVLSCLALHAPDRQQTNSSSTRLPATPGTHDVLCCVPLLFTWQLAGSASRSRPVVPKCDLASQDPMWKRACSAHVARPNRGRLAWLPSALCALQAGQGCLVGAAIAKAFYFHASVCVHAAMCLALTLGHAAV